MAQIILYVDSISNDLTFAETVNPHNIAYNNSLLETGFVEGFTDLIKEKNAGVAMGFIGRYIVTVEVFLDDKKYRMRFIDLEKDENKAQKYLKMIPTKEGQQMFIDVCRDYEKFYIQDYNSTVLVVGNAPQI